MIGNVVFLFALIVSASCMVLHQAQLPVLLPIQYKEPPPQYNFAYEVNDPHTGDFKRQQESRLGGSVLGQYSLVQPDGVTRTVDYRADDLTGFKAVVNNEGRPINPPSDREEENGSEGFGRQGNDRNQGDQYRQAPNDQQVTSAPVTVAHTSLIHRSYTGLSNPWI